MVFTRNIIFEGSVIEDKKNGAGSSLLPPSPVIAKFQKLNGGDYVASTLVQPEGIPDAPVLQLVEDGVMNVPVEATPFTQFLVHQLAEISVARHLM